MLTLSNIQLNNSRNKTYLSFKNEFTFNTGELYFIIGRSGAGKTSLIDFLSSPFTTNPIKDGTIKFGANIAKHRQYNIRNSSCFFKNSYIDFVKKSICYIPQKTSSFHPAVPVITQLYNYYKMALAAPKKPSKHEFGAILEELSPVAGYDKITFGEYGALKISDKKEYIAPDGAVYSIIHKQDEPKVFENEFSTGQLQRLLILLGLIRFRVSANPLLLADEFLVNFTYKEANDVLEKIIKFFFAEQKQNKTAVFIVHDLSFDFLRSLPKDMPVNLIALDAEKDGAEKSRTKDTHTITAFQMPLYDFYHSGFKNAEEEKIFKPFAESYKINSLPHINISPVQNDALLRARLDVSRPYSGVYNNIDFTINKNRFIVLTGFSGCGKSTLVQQFLSESVRDKKSIRYFPSRMLSFLSSGSQVTVRQDLQIIFDYYYGLTSIDECREELKSMLASVQFYESSDIDDALLDEFLSKKIFDLSGGQQQRYWFMRTLFLPKTKQTESPSLIVLDESIASLDCITKNKIISYLLQEVLAARKMTVFLISHDLRDIGVIYKTLSESNADIFEHYEMFNKNIYRVITPFLEYRTNLLQGLPNSYRELNSEKILNLKLNGVSNEKL